MLPTALDPGTLRTVALVAIAVVLVGILLTLRFVTKVVLRAVVLVVLLALLVGMWAQRSELSSCRSTGACTFFGQDVQVPDAVPREG